MRLAYLPANGAYAYVFGPDPFRAVIAKMGDAPMFHQTRAEAVAAANRCGMAVTGRGELVTLDCADEWGICSNDPGEVWCGGSQAARCCGRHVRDGLTAVTFERMAYRLSQELPA